MGPREHRQLARLSLATAREKVRVARAAPESGYHARDMLDDAICERHPNPPRGGLLSAVEKLVNEPPPPDYQH